MAEEAPKSALYVYRLTFGNKITAPGTTINALVLEQGVRKAFTDGTNNYYLTLQGIKVNRKIYQPTEINAELEFTQVTGKVGDVETTKTPAYKDVKDLLLQRQVKLEILHVNRKLDSTVTIDYGDSYTVAENCYVFEQNPQLKRDGKGTKMFVKLGIFSMDKLMTLNKYSKAYVARKLGSGILQPESLAFGTQKDASMPLVESDISGLRFLRYNDQYAFTEKGKTVTANIASEFIHPYLVQYNETFYDFLVRTSNRCGEFLYFEDGKLTLGLPDSGDPLTIGDYEAITFQSVSSDPLTIGAYRRDSMKDDEGKVEDGKLNQSAVEVNDSKFPIDVFPGNTSSNSEYATDEYIFPLYADKFSNLKREMYYDGDGNEIAMARMIPFFKTLLENDSDWKKGLPASIAKALIVGEGVTLGLATMQASKANKEKGKTYLDPLKDKSEQHNDEKAVQFGTLDPSGWTTLNYYEDVRKNQEEQQRQIICINMGTSYIPVKMGQKIKIPEMDSTYVVIQIQQMSEEAWNRDYDKYGTVADDKYSGKRSLKIYAIPAYGDDKKFVPPVQPVPIIRKVGPQTAFVTDNEDPKYQGRVRIAYPWQSLGSGLKQQLAEAVSRLKEAESEKALLEAKQAALLSKQTALATKLDELKKFIKASPEEQEKMLADKAAKRAKLEAELQTLTAEKAKKETEVTAKEEEIEQLKEKNAKQNAIEQKQVELEVAKKELLNTDIDKLNVQIKAKQDEIATLDQDIADLKAAADKPDEVLKKVQQNYDKTSQEYKDTSGNITATDKEISQRTEEKNKIAQIVEKKANDMATPWVRIASPMATQGGGTFFRPRVGDEVLVNYDNDNIERPYVVGSLFSKNLLTPDEGLYRKAAPEMQWGNISMSMMSPNGHHITFTDPKGGGGFFTNLISPGVGFYGSILGAGGVIKTAKDLAGGIHIGDRYGLYEIEMKSHKRAIDIRSPFGTVSINAFAGITISAPNGDVTIKGKNITLEAGNKINLLSGKNIADPGIGDPDGKGNKLGNALVGAAGTVAGNLTDKFASSVVDFSLARHVFETFVRPVDGTLKLKSKRYLMIEAGKGNTTIRSDRYSAKTESGKATSQAFFKAMLVCVDFISRKLDEYCQDADTLLSDGFTKQISYQLAVLPMLKDKKKPNIPETVYGLKKWSDDSIKLDLFQGQFKPDETSHGTTDQEKFNYLKESARDYGQATFNYFQHCRAYPKMLDDTDGLDLGLFKWLADCLKGTIPLLTTKRKDYTNYWDPANGKFDENQVFNRQQDNSYPFWKGDHKGLKRRLMVCFLLKVNDHPKNKENKYYSCKIDLDKIATTGSIHQEYYWNRMVLNSDRSSKLQNNLVRTLWDNTVAKVIDKAKSSLPAFDRDIWSDKADGQILFSDQENSTLNFEGEGVHEETSSNIGTLDHLKKVLMGVK